MDFHQIQQSIFFFGAAKETLPIEEKDINVVAPCNDLVVFEYLLKVTKLGGLFNSLLFCIHEEKPWQLPCKEIPEI